MAERFSLKDHLFNKKSVNYFADLFYRSDNNFKKNEFTKETLAGFPEFELKQRIVWVREILKKHLSPNYEKALRQILRALPPELDTRETDDDFGYYILAPLSNYIAKYGCTKKYLNSSLRALHECTKRFSVEDAIRYFINAFPGETFEFLTQGAHSDNYHVRRLSSEGTRPNLPWSIGINTDLNKPLPILDLLFADPTRYVTRSVANHMNDISKKEPLLVIQKLNEWKKTNKQNEKEMEFIMNHSLRTLLKQGNKKAFGLLGYSTKPRISLSNIFLKTPKVPIGSALEFSFELESLTNQLLMIDYIIDFQTQSGKTSSKTFKIKKGNFSKGDILSLSKKHPFRLMTTKKLYLGEHHCRIQINGTVHAEFMFTLV